MSLKNYLLAAFHFVCAVQFYYALYYEVVYVLPEELKIRNYTFGGKLVYLTFYDGIFHAVFHTIAFVNDFVGTNEPAPSNPPTIRKVRDFIFATLCIPLGTNVASLFWSLYAIDRELVFPKVMDSFLPGWLNHCLHSNVFLLITLEMFLQHHQYPLNRRVSVGCLAGFVTYYYTLVIGVRVFAGAWVYPILGVFNTYQRIGFFAGAWAIPIGYYFLGEKVNNKIWSEQRIALEKKFA